MSVLKCAVLRTFQSTFCKFSCEVYQGLGQQVWRFYCDIKMPKKWSMWLVCPSETHDPIPLEHKKPALIGRSPATRIVDPRCSRHQLELIADCDAGIVNIKQLGANSSALDGIEMIKGKDYKMKPNSLLYVLTGLYPQKLQMKETKPRRSISLDGSSTGSRKVSPAPTSKKRASTTSMDEDRKSKKAKLQDDKKNGSSLESTKKNKSSKLSRLSTEDRTGIKKEEDDDHMKEVEQKLKILKDSAKKLKKPPSVEARSSSVEVTVEPDMENSSCTSNLAEGWQQHDTLYVYTPKGIIARKKIAGFDIDGTIITTKSGKVFPTSPSDWKLFCKEIPRKLKKAAEDGFKIVFFTNQFGVSKGKSKMSDLKMKFGDILKDLDLPIQVYVATGGGQYRKPNIGMWRVLKKMGNDGIPIDVSQSFYVGDAAGRPEKWMPKKKKDFSCSDRLFAMNIGLTFYTPEEFFQGYPPNTTYKLPEFDPRKVSSLMPLLDPSGSKLVSGSPEVLILVGWPASGKSSFAKQHLISKGYAHVNRDTLGTWMKCVAACKDALSSGKSAVIDNTNPDRESRARYLQVAKEHGVPARCFLFTCTHTQARHNEKFREMTDKSHAPINDMVMNFYKKHFVPPEISEGFTEIVKVNFVPKFSSKSEEKLYKMFLIEK